MTQTYWSNTSGGDWTTNGNWTSGVPNALTDAIISYGGPYTVSLSTAGRAKSLLLDEPSVTFHETATGSLVAKGGLDVAYGAAILDGANALGDSSVLSGVLTIGNANALGFAGLTLMGGRLTNDVSVALANDLTLTGDAGGPQILAAHGTTFTLGGADGWRIADTTAFAIHFGAAGGGDGTVVWQSGAASLYDSLGEDPAQIDIDIDAGVLKAGDADINKLLNVPGGGTVDIAAGATLDLAGYYGNFTNLVGSGVITSAAPATLVVSTGSGFGGAITGKLSLGAAVVTLTGANTYSGGTKIYGDLQLGVGGLTGTIAATSAIDNEGELILDHSNTLTLANAISGAGLVQQEGAGTVILSHANTYSGGTAAINGAVEVANATAAGTGLVALGPGSRFVAGVNFVFPAKLDIQAATTLAAKAGTTLTTSATAPWHIGAASGNLTFGTASFTGTVVWNTPAGYSFAGAGPIAINIAYGTLKAGDSLFYNLTDNSAVTGTTLGAAGTLDAAGQAMAITNLRGSGSIIDSGAAATLNIGGGNFSGQINGAFTIYISGAVALTGGLGNFTPTLTIYAGTSLTLAGASAHNYHLTHNSTAATKITLAAGAGETGKLQGFTIHDTLDLRGVAFATATQSFTFNKQASTGGAITVSDGSHSETVNLVGNYTVATFTLADDGHGGTNVTVVNAVASARKGPASSAPAFASAMASLAAPVATILTAAVAEAIHPATLLTPRASSFA